MRFRIYGIFGAHCEISYELSAVRAAMSIFLALCLCFDDSV